MNPQLELLHPYPFARIARLLGDATPVTDKIPLRLSIGEPQHPCPDFVIEALKDNTQGFSRYPETAGTLELREAIRDWLVRRYDLSSTPFGIENLLPVNGTREALFAIAQLLVDSRKPGAKVAMPNPFYQIYEGAALLAGAEPLFMNCGRETGYLPDFDSLSDDQWNQVQLVYICNPGNPSGAVMPGEQLEQLIGLADKHDFSIVSDECYAEIYQDEDRPPQGLLEICRKIGRGDFRRCLVFHSLSKRSNMPGFRSGFVAGDSDLISAFLQYRTYHGCAMPLPIQKASVAAWRDETHVIENRQAYRKKFAAVLPLVQEVFDIEQPEAGFYLWLDLKTDDQLFAKRLYEEENLVVVPGSFLARDTSEGNPGRDHLRLALVGSETDCLEGIERLVSCYRRSTGQ